MKKQELKEYLHFEIHENNRYSKMPYILKKSVVPQYNAIYHIRKMQYHNSHLGIIHKIFTKLHHAKLQKKYLISCNPSVKIGLGVNLVHPQNIVIGAATIGKNFTLLHNTTIGSKREKEAETLPKPIIGDNVIMYSNSSLLGPITVDDNCIIGSFSLLLDSTEGSGTYIGLPAKKIKEKQ